MKTDATAITNGTASCKGLRICFWCTAIALGAADAWATRFTMNPDGISYLDMGDAYLRGNWHTAINGYWSPLYAWFLGLFLRVLKPSAYWEFPVAHLVNFVISVAALACFDFFLRGFITYQKKVAAKDVEHDYNALAEWEWWVLGYTLFISSSIALITLSVVTPDMCVAALVYLAAGLLLRIRTDQTSRVFVLLGMVLGFAYLAKSVMFVLAFPFLAAALFSYGNLRKTLPRVLLATAIFLGVASPLIVALTLAKHRLTFGDTGRVAYEVYVDGVEMFVPNKAAPGSVRKIFDQPAAYEFAQPVSGTYPLWYDASYWHEGIMPRFDVKGEIQAVQRSLLVYGWLLVTSHVYFTIAWLALVLMAPKPSRCFLRAGNNWPLMIPALAALGLYGLVYTEYRYVAPFVLLLWLAAFSCVSLPASRGSRRFIGLAVIAIAVTTLFFTGKAIVYELIDPVINTPIQWQVARDINRLGVKPGDKLVVIANEPFGAGGAFAARLARAQIIAQVSQPDLFWRAKESTRVQVMDALFRTDAKAILAFGNQPPDSEARWQRLGATSYYLYLNDFSGK